MNKPLIITLAAASVLSLSLNLQATDKKLIAKQTVQIVKS